MRCHLPFQHRKMLPNSSPQRLKPDLFLSASARLQAAPFQNRGNPHE
jgi:hypothetical protein